ncbi:unnamed protein product [Rotaria sordida]|uniref:Glycosyltransferase 61 catalytic domain-containing protein n=2 Tax=Rotaria sordida TaxID=392033 RepID=A0A814H4C0_9BILA|nr:unnamed protein product [Rotaria sordida]CAF1119497.1 unnamed protein product [Rotaria sordida]
MRLHPILLIKTLILLILFIAIFDKIYLQTWHSKIKIILIERKLSTVLTSNDEFNQISYTLEPFTAKLPHFSDDEARNWFLNSTYYKLYSKQCPNNACETNGFLFNGLQEHRQVHIAFIKNGLYLNDKCGYRYSEDAMRRTFKSSNQPSVIYDKAIIYTVAHGWRFQHFLDGIGPKLSHSKIYLDKYPDAKVVIERGPWIDRSVEQIWALMGVNESNRLIHYKHGTKLGAHLLINPCRTPATHPILWHDARRLYWSLANLPRSDPLLSRNKLIYVRRTRINAKISGRHILNEKLLINIVREYALKHSLEFIQYDHLKENRIEKEIELFYQARIIIGVHGGALSNINYAQSQTTIIEIMPYRAEQNTAPVVCIFSKPDEVKPCVGYIYYVQAQLLNHTYWILPTEVDDEKNLHVNLTRVKRLFDSLV